MTDPIRILIVEDSAADAELALWEIRDAGLRFESRRVDAPVAFIESLDGFRPDLILCDYSLPGADGLTFLRLARAQRPDLPFLFVSGTIGEERAIEAMKAGATDYVLKSRWSALPMKVRRALDEVAERRRRERAEEQMRHLQRVDALGRLAGGIAHDFNNALTVIQGYADLSLREVAPENTLRPALEEIRKAAARAGELTARLLAFGRRQALSPSTVKMDEVVAGLEPMLRSLLGERVRLFTCSDPSVQSVRVDRGQIEQAIVNLVINARDAMPNGGPVTLETANADVSADPDDIHPLVAPGKYVTLGVRDAGCGMIPDVLSRIFEPFFTTKPEGRGTGLGLAIVHGIVKQSNGDVRVESRVGEGTTVTIYLPAVRGGRELPATP